VLFFYLLSKLPFRVLFGISDSLYFLIYYVIGYRKKVVRQNLERSFPEKSADERKQIERKFFRHLCDVVVETIKLLSISEEELKNRVDHQSIHILEESHQGKFSFISMCPHYGNWEYLLLGNQVYLGNPIDAVYKPLSSPFFEKLMLRIRSRFGSVPVPSPKILRIEATRKHIPRAIAMVADQTPGPEGAYITTFLNQPTYFFRGPVKISETFGYPVYYSNMEKVGRGRYRIFIEKMAQPPFQNPDAVLDQFIEKMERDIRKAPEFWLWSHKRWKHKVPLQDKLPE
jgi:KDO2-lipid IV(A) lauroyltransferase